MKNKKKKMAQYTKEEKENKCQYIAGLFRKGWSKLMITEHLSELWGIKKQASAHWIKLTYKYINSNDESFVRHLRRIQLERLELMLCKAMEKEDWKTANTIADTINKTFSLYEIKQKIEITDNVIKFKFGEVDENAYKNIDSNLTEEQEDILEEANQIEI